ncbi:Uncharacterised protein [Mycobacteroides abscessus subsp. abscessus]|nr:Uncharacterised protein [Mycobacteroides abscessus subsp. abscessus]
MSSLPNAPSPNGIPYKLAFTSTLVPALKYSRERQCTREPCASSGSQAHPPSVGGSQLMLNDRSTAALSAMCASN